MPSYLVFYCGDPVDDELAAEITRRVRGVTAGRAGWFDEPDAASAAERTCGGYLQTEDLAADEATALLEVARALSAELELTVAVEFNERPLGQFAPGGVPGGALPALLR
jgi:hypothetical protein